MARQVFESRGINSTKLQVKLRNSLGQFVDGGLVNSLAREVNRKSVDWLHDRALDNLQKQIAKTGRPDEGRTGLLAATIEDRDMSTYTLDRFDFWIYDRVNERMSSRLTGQNKRSPYWRALEEGTTYFVGKRVRVGFRSGGRMIEPDGARRRMDAPVRNQLQATYIRNPIPSYHYLKDARESFRTSGRYKFFIRRVFTNKVPSLKLTGV